MKPIFFLAMFWAIHSCGKSHLSLSYYDDQQRNARLFSAHFAIVAHRGASGSAPENTLPAIQKAIDYGAHVVEVDYHDTLDGQTVLLHDRTLNRTTNANEVWGEGDHNIKDVKFADVRKLDAGSWYGENFSGTQVPTLAESLDAIQGRAIALIEHKAGDARSAVKIIQARNVYSDLIVQSFSWRYLKEVKELDANIPTMALGRTPVTEAIVQDIVKLGATAVNWNHNFLNAEVVAMFKDHGLFVYAYTVNDVERAAALKAMGVDGLVTNHPELMMDVSLGDPSASPQDDALPPQDDALPSF